MGGRGRREWGGQGQWAWLGGGEGEGELLPAVEGRGVKWVVLDGDQQQMGSNADAHCQQVEEGQSARGVAGDVRTMLPCAWWKGRKKGRCQWWWCWLW